MTRPEWYRTLDRCIAATGVHPCRGAIERFCEPHRKAGQSAYAVAAELWRGAGTQAIAKRDGSLEGFDGYIKT